METCYAFPLFLGHKSLQLGGILVFRETPEGFTGIRKCHKGQQQHHGVGPYSGLRFFLGGGGFEVKTGGGMTARVLKKAQNIVPTCL